ncbi:hypothetical protein S83_013456, partial [Arachis hypogaea]
MHTKQLELVNHIQFLKAFSNNALYVFVILLLRNWNHLNIFCCPVVAAESLALTLQVSCNLKDSKELLERCLNARKVLLPNDHIQ